MCHSGVTEPTIKVPQALTEIIQLQVPKYFFKYFK